MAKASADHHFNRLQSLLAYLGLQEAHHRSPLHSQDMVWLGLRFNTLTMRAILSQGNRGEIMSLVRTWLHKKTDTIHELHSLLGKLIYVAQFCHPTRHFTNRMVLILRECPEQGFTHLSTEFKKDLAWFEGFLRHTDGVFIIHEDNRDPICLFVDTCTSGCRAVSNAEAYCMEFPLHILQQDLSIWHLEALNAVVAVKVWAPKFAKHLIHLLPDNSMAVAILQAGKGRDLFLQACTWDIWLTCAAWDITLAMEHVAVVTITATTDTWASIQGQS